MININVKRFALFCNPEGQITEILQDEDHIIPTSIVGKMIFSVIVPGDLNKVLNFFIELKKRNIAFGWEINVDTSDGPETFSFFGGVFEDRLGIAAATSKIEAQSMFTDLIKINNEQANIIRTIQKENTTFRPGSEEPSISYYDELSHLNNELVNMHRELAKKNSALDDLNKLKNEFLGIAAHDLRNPLGIIMGYSDALLHESEGALSDVQKMMLQEILSSSRFMLGLLNDLLDISAIESGKVKLELARSDLGSLVIKNVELNNVIAHKKNINIVFSKVDDIPEILIDASKIEQVLNNLISNAIKYSHPDTVINVTISKSSTEIIVSVADQGQGIPTNEICKLFKPFEKISVKSTSGEKSTGLGLSIVSNLIKAHKGKIWAESEVGKGSTFYFSLSLVEYFN